MVAFQVGPSRLTSDPLGEEESDWSVMDRKKVALQKCFLEVKVSVSKSVSQSVSQ